MTIIPCWFLILFQIFLRLDIFRDRIRRLENTSSISNDNNPVFELVSRFIDDEFKDGNVEMTS